MSSLLRKTTRPFFIYILSIFLLSIPIYYFVIEKIWIGELDEHNAFNAKNALHYLQTEYAKGKNLDTSINYWNNTQFDTHLKIVTKPIHILDSLYTTDATHLALGRKSNDNFRTLVTTLNIQDHYFLFRSATSFENTKKTIVSIGFISLFGYLTILIGFILYTKWLSSRVRDPFLQILNNLKSFSIKNHSQLLLPNTDITEFDELNRSIYILAQNNIAIYNSQKEFIENASHELKTPLAVIKNLLDLLFQSGNLSTAQYGICEEINIALMKGNKISKNLLLLAKLDNKQYVYEDQLNFSQLFNDCFSILETINGEKNLSFELNNSKDVLVKGNKILTEILINNLLVNVINYSNKNDVVYIFLDDKQFIVCNPGTESLNDENLFNRFSKKINQKNSNGLGLAIVHEICIYQNWKVSYQFENSQHQFIITF